jgi:RNA polymerase sigma-70 factor (ECF subfamily)
MLSQQVHGTARFANDPPRSYTPGSSLERGENELIAAAKQGDAAAYGSLVRKYQDRLCSSLCYVCGSLADAQDAAQEAFLRAYLKLDSFTGASAFYTWLYRIAVNAVMSEKRKERARLAREQTRSQQDELLRERVDRADDDALRTERIEQVRSALDSLGIAHRTILVLREIDNCDYEEISTILKIPVGTVRSRLHRARLELRDRLR